jgi:quercetin dioxygenase-like cupin family protein
MSEDSNPDDTVKNMGFLDINKLNVIERLPGWKGRYFDSNNMTFGHYVFAAGASIHEHSHPNEEVWNIIEGHLEVTIGAESKTAGPGFVAIVPPNTLHSVKAISNGRAIVVDYPLRAGMGEVKK